MDSSSSQPSPTPLLPDEIPDSSWLLGLQFFCDDDDFVNTPAAASAYPRLPEKGGTYTLNEVHPAFDNNGQLVYAGNFEEIPPYKPNCGLFLHRFRIISDHATIIARWRPDPKQPCSLLMCALESFHPPDTDKALLGTMTHARLGVSVTIYRNVIN